mgnify:CR=1 FL=1
MQGIFGAASLRMKFQRSCRKPLEKIPEIWPPTSANWFKIPLSLYPSHVNGNWAYGHSPIDIQDSKRAKKKQDEDDEEAVVETNLEDYLGREDDVQEEPEGEDLMDDAVLAE